MTWENEKKLLKVLSEQFSYGVLISDAATEKLIAEIERRKDVHRKNYEEFKDERFINDECEDDRILALIASLRQEQPFPRWIHANYSDKPEIRQSPSGGPYLQSGPYMIWLSDLETLPKDGTDLTNPVQEQPEMDLEKEIREYFEGWRINYYSETEELLKNNGCTVDIDDVKEIARHFYELGLNARK